MVDVQQRALRAFEQQRFAARARVLEQAGDIGNHRTDFTGQRQQFVARARERHGVDLVVVHEHEIVQLEQGFEFAREQFGV